MPEVIGSHLLGRKPSVPDPRDYQLAHFLSGDPLDAALAALVAKHYSKQLKLWASLITKRVEALSPTPPVPPTPPAPTPVPSKDVVWSDSDQVLDQGDTGHCVGGGWCGWADTLPIDDHYKNADLHAVYYEAKIIDGEPGQEDGSTVRSGAKAMQNRKRLTAYAFATTIDEVRAWVTAHGPVVFGTDWDQSMFDADANGFVKPDGNVQGGHCYVCVGDIVSEGALIFQNSWGANWAAGGRFYMKYEDAATLVAREGEMCAAVELPV